MMLWTVVLTAASLMCCTAAQDNLTCVENPTGEVSLNVAVRGVPGPEGPQGSTGEVGPRGVKGERGLRGLRGLKGDRGDIGGVGKTGPKGEIGTKGQKGSRGIQGIPGPVGSPGLAGGRGSRGYPGVEGPTGPSGQPGSPGPRGPQGEDGDTVLSEEEFQAVSNRLKDSVVDAISTNDEKQLKRLDDMKDNLTELIEAQQAVIDDMQEQLKNISENPCKLVKKHNITKINSSTNSIVKCGVVGDWRRVSYFNTTLGHSCPSQLRTVTNTNTGQKACGRTGTSAGCTSLNLAIDGEYSKVCGFIRGYVHGDTPGFYPYSHSEQRSIDSTYAAGVLLSQGSPRQHLWSYIAGVSESTHAAYYRCPCATDSFQSSWIPSFVGNHYFCESGFSGDYEIRTVWEDPLWDGKGCTVRGNSCCTCTNCGWFHRQVQPSSDSIEVRICGYYLRYSYSDVPIDQLEIWVM